MNGCHMRTPCLCVVLVAKHREDPRREESGTVESRGNEKHIMGRSKVTEEHEVHQII